MTWESVLNSAIAAVPPTLVALMSWRSSRGNRIRIIGVHRIVNSQRSAMMKEIDGLKKEIAAMKLAAERQAGQ